MAQQKHILLTGGSGFIGMHLTAKLLAKGYKVSCLSRWAGKKDTTVETFLWDINKGEVDARCIDDVDIIVHLAGAGIADKRWTRERKKELINSRTRSIRMVYQLLKSKSHHVSTVISASATGYYGNRGDELLTENSPPAPYFLGTCCVEWEKAVDEGAALGLRVVKYRTGVVLNKTEGALARLATPVKLYVGSALGSGKQWVPWVHWHDVIDMYLYAIENKSLTGAFNMATPNPVTNKTLIKAVANRLGKPLWLPNVPAFILKLLLGQMSVIVLASTKVSVQKITGAGYKFKYPEITSALKQIYKS